MIFENETIKEILEKYKPIWAIEHAMSLMSWDSETYMPREGFRDRAVARAELSLLHQQLLLRPEFVELVEKADRIEDLNDYERGVVRVLKRAIKVARALPPWLVAERAKVTQEATIVWREARAKDNFDLFKPYLEKIFELTKKTADYLGWDRHPYDALLDLAEEGLRTDDIDRVFNHLKRELKWIIQKVIDSGLYPREHRLERFNYEIAKMDIVNRKVLELLEFPFNERSRLDVSPHPFTVDMGLNDVRITTRYEGVDFKKTLYSVLHEYGHALYQLQIDPSLSYTPLATGASPGIHEGQSRFWENIIGRSMEFTELIYPILREHLEFMRNFTVEDLYYYFNTVRPDVIRVDADEVTYNMHIILRTELEKLAISGEIRVSDIPELWSEYMEKLLGIRPRSHSEGVLQDIHWSAGGIGYFPGYTLGNIVAAMIKYAIDPDIKLYHRVRDANFGLIRNWLRNKIHMYGAIYPPKELLRRSLGEEYNPEYLVKHLVEKYLKK